MKEKDNSLVPENTADQIILESLARYAQIYLAFPFKVSEWEGKPYIKWRYDRLIADWELPFDTTLLGEPTKEHAQAEVVIHQLGEYGFNISLRNWMARPQFRLPHHDYSLELPQAAPLVIVAEWDETKKEPHPLD